LKNEINAPKILLFGEFKLFLQLENAALADINPD